MAVLALVAVQVHAQGFMIASAAGYKKPVMAVLESFEKTTGIQTHAVYGNMQMVASQAKQSGEISCIIGDKKFLDKLCSTINFSDYHPVGKGVLVLAYRKGIRITKIEDLLAEKIQSLFIPQDGKAIYGVAGSEALKSYNLGRRITRKVTRVATVPQVVSYLLTGEADTGFINLTEALANKDRLGGYIVVPQNKYTEIRIVAGVVQGFCDKPDTKKFLNFIQSKKAATIFRGHGL